MISPGSAVWVSVKHWLRWYCRRDKSIRHCFIRHSTAGGPQNPLLADFDLAFFAAAADFDELQIHARRIRDDLRKSRILSCIGLPATEAAYRMCASHYPFRSVYPMKDWRCLYGDAPPISGSLVKPLPLDHAPESFLFSYIGPVLLGTKRRHILEGALMRRKLNRDSLWITGEPVAQPIRGFHDVVAAEVRLWDAFYGRIEFNERTEAISHRSSMQFSSHEFEQRWRQQEARLSGLVSVWVYPCFFDHRTPYLVLNVEPTITAERCETIISAVLQAFQGLAFRLQIGTERSMLARLSGLSRVSLLDPWLFRSDGRCLYGRDELRNAVREPTLEQMKDKLQEYLLYLSYRVFCLRPYPHSLYRLAFTLDRLFLQRELVMNPDELGEIYGRALLPQSQLQGPNGRKRFLDAWKVLHGFDLF